MKHSESKKSKNIFSDLINVIDLKKLENVCQMTNYGVDLSKIQFIL